MATTKKATSKGSTTKKATAPKKGRASKKKLDTKNVKDTVKTIVETKRELKYLYPEGMKDTVERKTYRQKVRNKIYKFEREIAKLEGKALELKQKKYAAYRKEVLMVP